MIKNVNFFFLSMFKCKLHYFVCAKTKGGHTTDLWHDGIGIKNSKLQKKINGKEKQKAKYKSLILLIMISQQNNKSLSSIVS